MKYIKKFNSVEDLEESGLNLAPQEYTLYFSDSYTWPSFSYHLEDAEYANFTGTTEGLFGEITPGVAYLDTQENKNVLYNPKFKPIELGGSTHTWTWEQFGMTTDLYNKYLDSAKAYEHPLVFNISIDGNAARRVEYNNYSNPTTEELSFGCDCWTLHLNPINNTVSVTFDCE